MRDMATVPSLTIFTHLFLALLLSSCPLVFAKTRYFNFTIENTRVTRLCHTKSAPLVNRQFPGPAQYVEEGDKVIVNVTNLASYNATIHWHGVRQFLSAWADGPAYITQCPIQTGHSFVHRFKVVGQRGTLFWHAHASWLRATLYGAFIILPKDKTPFPFKKPHKELPPLLLGEWWNANVEDVIALALRTGGTYNVSNALTINGQPGDLYNCSSAGTFVYNVSRKHTYLLRIINAAVNFQMFFAIANHSLTVVESDAEYTQPLKRDMILLAPGQSTSVLFTTNQAKGEYYIAASVYSPPNISLVPFPLTPTTAILRYKGAKSSASSSLIVPTFPLANDSRLQVNFTQSLRGRNYSEGYYYSDVPQTVDLDLLHTVGYALQPCPPNAPNSSCLGPNTTIFRSSVNNITFVSPDDFSIMQAYYKHVAANYTTNFPDVPLFQYNYTAVNPVNKAALPGTRVRVLPYNTTVQVVYQNTATLFFESHPMHLHGQSFYVVGTGNGTYNPSTDPQNFNLMNPPSRNTIAVFPGGWAAVRFRAINPGVWFLHCHFDIHLSWGMDMAFITLNGVGPSQTLPPPPKDLPQC